MTTTHVTVGMALVVLLACGGDRPSIPDADPVRAATEDTRFHTSPRFASRVVDATTGEPISGAVVLAIWRLIEVPAGRWHYGGMFRIAALRTDSDGRFEVPRWGPRHVARGTCLDRRDPELWILRRGYLLGYFDNVSELDSARYFAAEQTLPPGKLPPFRLGEREGMCRSSDEPPAWSGRDLRLARPSAPVELRRSLGVANPIDPLDLSSPRLPEFWSEWRASAAGLPPEVAGGLTVPAPLLREEEDEAMRKSLRIPP